MCDKGGLAENTVDPRNTAPLPSLALYKEYKTPP